ncbi:L-rhamnose isomerase [Clostridioides difficile]
MSNTKRNYEIAKELYAQFGVDTDKALETLRKTPISVHCWQIDDLTGFENPDAVLSGGIAAFGNAPGKPRSKEEYMANLDKALSYIPGAKKLALHAVYLNNFGEKVERNEIEPKHFEEWVKYAKEKGIGLDFNPTYFSHEKAEEGFTLASKNEEVRQFWIEHGKRCRKIGEYFGRELGQTCLTNHWIPDGYKDNTIDKVGPRLRLKDSLDKIFEERIDPKYNIDSVESKLFGLGSESYVVGSHEFYTNYVMTNDNCIICMDAGHFHPTELVSQKISSYLAFDREIMLHVSRPVRWDSDHVVLFDDETKAIMQEIVRYDALDKVHIGLDFFDASIDRISATVIGARNAKKALLSALLEPTEELIKVEKQDNLTKRLALSEEIKSLPFGLVWDMFCEMENVPNSEWVKEI